MPWCPWCKKVFSIINVSNQSNRYVVSRNLRLALYLAAQPGARESSSAAKFFFGSNPSRASSTPKQEQIEDGAPRSPHTRKHGRESSTNGLSLDLPPPAPTAKRNRRSNGTEVSTNGHIQSSDAMQIDQNGHNHSHHERPEPVSPANLSPADDAQATNGMDVDEDVDAPSTPTPEEPPLTLTLTNGESKGVQSDKISELGPLTSVLSVPDTAQIMHAAWNPKDPTILAVGGDALCRLWYISKTAASADNPSHKSFVDIHDESYGSLVTTLAWSPNGEILAVATRNDSSEWVGAVCLYTKMGKAVDQLPAAQDIILTLRWSPSGNQLLAITTSGTGNSLLMLWDVNSSQAMPPYQLQSILTDAAFVANDRLVVCGHQIIASSLLENQRIITLQPRSDPDSQSNWTHIRYDSRTHITALAAEETAVLGLVDSSDTLRVCKAHDDEITALAFQPVTNLSAYPAAAPRLLATSSLDRTVKIWDARRPFTTVHVLSLGYAAPAMALSFTPDGYLVAAANWNRVLIWNAEAGGVPKASWKGELGKLADGLLTNGNAVDGQDSGMGQAESICSLSWDAEGGKLVLGVGSQVCLNLRNNRLYDSLMV